MRTSGTPTRQKSATPQPAAVGTPFRDAKQAEASLARILPRLPAPVAQTLFSLLSEVPDPDSALNLFERLMEAGPDVGRLFERNPFLLHYALTVFGFSQFLGETLIQNRDLLQGLLREKGLDLTRSREEIQEAFARFRSRSLETEMSVLLARFKRREYIRIMLRDVLKIATLAETTAEISALTDVLIDEAMREADSKLRRRYGAPQHVDTSGRLVDTPFAILSLGKLGGNELNYSSDIDLLFLYGEEGEAAGGENGAISNHEFFIRLAQEVTEGLSRHTHEGAAFRVDLRLRPQGGEGEPAVGLGHALDYYAKRAQDWELQALIKVRYSAGNQRLAREFIRRVQPYVYTERLNFAAIETALKAREKIGSKRRFRSAVHKETGIDVKLDPGGIRDIEFLVQCLQRVYGGTELWLRSGGTLFSLQKLHDKQHITGKEFQALSTAYEFLRKVEHRLQLRQGQQTHRLPENQDSLRVLCRAVGGEAALPEEFVELVKRRMSRVAEIYARIIHHQHHQHQQLDQQCQQEPSAGTETEFQLEITESREEPHRQMMNRLAVDSPQLYQMIQALSHDGHTRRNLYRFLSASFTSSERYAAVARHPAAVENAMELFAHSELLTDMLVRHPEEIVTLARATGAYEGEEPNPLFPAEETVEIGAPASLVAYLETCCESYQEKLAVLRRHYRSRTFALAARDVIEGRRVFPSLRDISATADYMVAAACSIVRPPAQFSVLALGRLGSEEMDVLSDADLLFVRGEDVEMRDASRAAEKIVEALSSYTREGTVFPVDTRLRPRGSEGELVITPAFLESYFQTAAQAWEALTYTKLRYIAGSREVAAQAIGATGSLFSRFAGDPEFIQQVREMRTKLEKSDSSDNLKTGPGGVYDLDFLLGFLLVRHGVSSTHGNMRDRLRNLATRGLLAREDAAELSDCAELLRAVEHAMRLVSGRARKSIPVAGQARQAVAELTSRLLNRSVRETLEEEVNEIRQRLRCIYDRVLA